VESFENLNRPDTPSARANLPTPFVFPSGVTLSNPTPNRSDSFGVFIVDKMGFFGYVYDNRIPDGTSYLGQANNGLFDSGVEFTFLNPQLRVGAFTATPLTISVYGTTGNLLESIVDAGASIDDWKNHFIGIQRNEGIKRIVFKGAGDDVLRLDELTFEAVPEPSTLALLGMSLVSLIAYTWQRWKELS
jgi:hypothetical protein